MLATFLENSTFVGVLVPGDVAVLVAGVYAQRGALALHRVMMFAFVGAVLGDVVGYVVGRLGGRPLAARYGRRLFLPADRLARFERYFERHGTWAVLIGRFAPMIRTVRTFVAGMSRMPFWKFALASIPSAAVWAAGVAALGYIFAESIDATRRTLGAGGMVVLVGVIVLVAVTYRTMLRRLDADEAARGRRP